MAAIVGRMVGMIWSAVALNQNGHGRLAGDRWIVIRSLMKMMMMILMDDTHTTTTNVTHEMTNRYYHISSSSTLLIAVPPAHLGNDWCNMTVQDALR